jgi:hypothetical protein
MLESLSHAGILALLTLIIAVVPMVMGVIYAVRPSETRLALMRPLSLAGLFAGLAGLMAGLVSIFRMMAIAPGPFERVALALSESLVPLFVAFGSLTVGWLCVALGLNRQP